MRLSCARQRVSNGAVAQGAGYSGSTVERERIDAVALYAGGAQHPEFCTFLRSVSTDPRLASLRFDAAIFRVHFRLLFLLLLRRRRRHAAIYSAQRLFPEAGRQGFRQPGRRYMFSRFIYENRRGESARTLRTPDFLTRNPRALFARGSRDPARIRFLNQYAFSLLLLPPPPLPPPRTSIDGVASRSCLVAQNRL